MKRRWWLAGGGAAAVTAAAAGAAWFLHREARDAPAAPAALWQQRFPRPEGGDLDMAALLGRPLVLNFWATWCAPCVHEMPRLDAFAREFAGQGWQVVGLAADQTEAVRRFLTATPVGFPIGIAGAAALGWSRAWGNLYGALPFSVVVDRRGRAVHRRLGEAQADEMRDWTRLPGLRD